MNREQKPSQERASTPDIAFGPGGQRRGPGGPMGARLNAEKPKNLKKIVGRLLRYIGKSGIVLIALLVIMITVTGAELMGPFFQAKAIDTITVDEATGRLSVDFSAMLQSLVAMGVVFVCAALLSFFQTILSAKLFLPSPSSGTSTVCSTVSFASFFLLISLITLSNSLILFYLTFLLVCFPCSFQAREPWGSLWVSRFFCD